MIAATGPTTGLRSIASQRLALGALLVGMAITATSSWGVAANVADDQRSELDALALQARTAIERRAASYAEPLYGMSGALSGDQPIGRAGFHRYVELAGTARRQPGLLAYTFNRFVPEGGTALFEDRVRADESLMPGGYPAFSVHPAPSGGSVVIDYVEPRAGNEGIFGFDVLSDLARRSAVEAARDGGHLVATEPVMLVQESGGSGFLLYLPVYETPEAPATAPSRRRHFAGVVTAVVSFDQMLAGVLGPTARERPRISVQLSDVGATLDPRPPLGEGGSVLFDSDPQKDAGHGHAAESRSVDLNVGGRRWRLTATPATGLGSIESLLPWFTGIGGGMLSLLLAGLLASLASSKGRAVALAAGMTESLQRQEDELRRANLHLAESNAALARADQAKDAFLGVMSHDLRTPLSAISGFARLLDARWDRLQPGERRESLARIMHSAATLGGLVDDLLEFNRTGDQAPPLAIEAVDIALVAREVVDALDPLVTLHDLRLVTSEAFALADRVALARIVTNLVTNAVKFAPEGTTVRVSTSAARGTVVLEVADQGPGVPSEQRDLVFDRFYRGAHPGHPRRPGTGIGLAVVKDLSERMGGSVRVSDAPGGGAVFVVVLPSPAGPALVGIDAAAEAGGPS